MIRLGHNTANWLKVATAIAILVTLAAMINAQGEQTLRREVERNLTSLIDVIANSIDVSYQQAIGEVQYIAAQPRIRAAAQALLMSSQGESAPPATATREQLHQLMQPLLRSKGLRGFAIVTPDGRNIASSDDLDVDAPHPAQLQPLALARVWAGGTLITHPLSSDTPGQPPTMFALSPIRDGTGAPIALLALRHDPEALLYHTLRLGFTGRSGESYAFDRDGLLLSESRFDEQLRASGALKGAQRSFRNISLTPPGSDSLTLMAASATAGRSGVNADGYPDYRGVNVVGAWRWMASYNFGIAVEADSVEAIPGISLIQNALAGITLHAANAGEHIGMQAHIAGFFGHGQRVLKRIQRILILPQIAVHFAHVGIGRADQRRVIKPLGNDQRLLVGVQRFGRLPLRLIDLTNAGQHLALQAQIIQFAHHHQRILV